MGKPKAPAADDNLDELFEGLDTGSKPKTAKPKKLAAAAAAPSGGNTDILAELESQLTSEKPSRPHTPRIKDPASASAARKSTESARSLRNSFTPSAGGAEQQQQEQGKATTPASAAAATAAATAATAAATAAMEEPTPAPPQQQHEASGGSGGWWGGFLSTATAAMKQAEAAVKEIQRNEEAQRWAEQVRGNVGALRGLGDELRQRAVPTFTNILHTLAPPISSHEQLLVHITHDFAGYPSLDPMIHSVFGRVMAQVEGGDLLVVQRGRESSGRASSASGWQDGPWWRQSDVARELGLVAGLVEGTKLCRASAEGYAAEYFAAHGGLDQAKLRATESLSESNPVRTSNLFLAVQAISTPVDEGLFARSSAKEKEAEGGDSKVAAAAAEDTDEVCFAIFILDPIHEIEFSAVSQAVPAKWVRWLDASAGKNKNEGDESGGDGEDDAGISGLPEEIRELIRSGGVDPREWIAEWVEEALTLAVGVVAQRYVARRMGVGDGGLGKGKMRAEEIIQDGAGEAARAGLI